MILWELARLLHSFETTLVLWLIRGLLTATTPALLIRLFLTVLGALLWLPRHLFRVLLRLGLIRAIWVVGIIFEAVRIFISLVVVGTKAATFSRRFTLQFLFIIILLNLEWFSSLLLWRGFWFTSLTLKVRIDGLIYRNLTHRNDPSTELVLLQAKLDIIKQHVVNDREDIKSHILFVHLQELQRFEKTKKFGVGFVQDLGGAQVQLIVSGMLLETR